MTEIKEVLEQAVRSVEATPSEQLIESDVRRGRAALARSRRRRTIRSSVLGAAAATLVVGGVMALGSNEAEPPSAAQVQLVAYGGEQLDGFVVDRIPEGWYLQGSSPFALTIAPEGTSNTHPDNFIGKLVVMLFSQDVKKELPEGQPVDVGDNEGVVIRSEEGARLFYEDGAGHFVEIQAPDVLGWTNEELTQFAEGVQVTVEARPTRG